MHIAIESIRRLAGGTVQFAFNLYDDAGQKLLGAGGNRILVNEATGNINVYPVSIKIGKRHLQVGFIHFSIWPAIYRAISQAIQDSDGDDHLLSVAKVRLEL